MRKFSPWRDKALVAALIHCWTFVAFFALGAEPASPPPHAAAAKLEFFEKKVRPVLADHCYSCHGPDKQESSFRVDHRDHLLRGGDYGAAVIPGEPEKSRLIEAIRYQNVDLQMPPKGKLTGQQIADLTEWVKIGAPWPPTDQQAGATDTKKGINVAERLRAHWAWQPIRPHVAPQTRDPTWPITFVDAFLLQQLEVKGIRPAPPADRTTLLRRLSFDLIGLPPTPEELRDFLADTAPDATERAIDRLLDSPHFGEKWARHWLDLVRYAETYGHEFDYPIAHAYKYRDYVIRAWNRDVPYDQWLREHLAGDLLPQPRRDPDTGVNESIIGTGFWYFHEQTHAPVDVLQHEADRVDNQIDVFSKTFLGVTLACARCHDHKFDPITTKDYYSLAAFLRSSRVQESLDDPRGNIAQGAAALREARDTATRTLAQALGPWSKPELAADFSTALLATRPNTPPATTDDAKKTPRRTGLVADYSAWRKAWEHQALQQPQHPLHGWWYATRGKVEDSTAVKLPPPPLPVTPRPGDLRLARFAEQGFRDWFITGTAFDNSPTSVGQWDPRTRRLLPGGLAHSAVLAPQLWGTLRSPTFTLDKPFLHLFLGGRGASFHVIVDGYIMDSFSGLLFEGLLFTPNQEEKLAWRTVDVRKYLGHRAYLEILDHGDGFAVLGEMVLSDHAAPPQKNQAEIIIPLPPAHNTTNSSAANTSRSGVITLVQLSQAYGARLADAVVRWRAGQANAGDAELLDGLLEHHLLHLTPEIRKSLDECSHCAQRLARTLTPPERVLAMTDGTGESGRVYLRGNHRSLGDLVPRRTPDMLGAQPMTAVGSGRRELADKLLAPNNPLVARVAVNRVWHHLFGNGLVPSVDNLGKQGQLPSHPELLDTLAHWFRTEGQWSHKRLIRLLARSRAYQMASHGGDEKGWRDDPTNTLLHHMLIRRLPGEAIRDALLTVSGRLDRKQFGPSVPIHLTTFMEGRGRPGRNGPLDGAGRRSIYMEVRRNFLSPMMLAFDTPAPFSTMGKRTQSNVPAQALILLNDPFIVDQAKTWARCLLVDSNTTATNRITQMYRAAFTRDPNPHELAAAEAFLRQQASAYRIPQTVNNDERPWADLAHVLFNVKEFIFLR